MELPFAKLLRRVVIIYHDPTYSQFLSRLIAGLGHEVIEITDPCTSDLTELKVTDVVFLDVMWPRGEGLQALKTIARQSSNCSIALVCGANEHPKAPISHRRIISMANFIITYDLNGPFPSHKQMDDHLRRISIRYCRILETVWWVEYAGTAVQLRDQIATILGKEDLLLVIEAATAAWTKLLIPNVPFKQAFEKAA